jgi:hypothetical protein
MILSVSEGRKTRSMVPSRHAIRVLEHAVYPMVQHVRNPMAGDSNSRPNRQNTRSIHHRHRPDGEEVILERYSVAMEAPSSSLGLLADWPDPIAVPDLLATAIAVAPWQALVELWFGVVVPVCQKNTSPLCPQMASTSRRRADRKTSMSLLPRRIDYHTLGAKGKCAHQTHPRCTAL